MVDFPLPIRVEAAFGADPDSDPSGWVWTDLSARAFVDASPAAIAITRGRQDESSEAQASQMTLRLDNRDGALTPYNPMSPYWPHVVKGCPIRARLDGVRLAGMYLDGQVATRNSWGSTPSAAALDVTDLDLRVELTPDTWRPAADEVIAARYVLTDDNRSWVLQVGTLGDLRMSWSTDGTFGALQTRLSTPLPADTGQTAVRVTVDVDNGAGGHTVTFYVGPTVDGPWTQWGAQNTTAGTTTIYAPDAPLTAGSGGDSRGIFNGGRALAGMVHAVQVRDGIEGTIAANADFGAQTPGATTFTDSAGRPWTLQGDARITDPATRFLGTMAAILPTWPYGDLSDAEDPDTQPGESRVDITAAGALRRLGQGRSALRSPLFRDLSTKPEVVAYWPMEDGEGAAVFASGLADGAPPLRPFREVDPADFDGFVASEPLPTVGAGHVSGPVPEFVGADHQRVMTLVAIPDDGVGATRVLLRVTTSGAVPTWDVIVDATGDLAVVGRAADGTAAFDSGFPFTWDLNGARGYLSLLLQQDGATVHWQAAFFREGGSAGAMVGSHTTAYDRVTVVRVGDAAGVGGVAFGHLAVLNDDVTSIWDVVSSSLVAWSGETAADRMTRLSAEQGVPFALVGDGADTAQVGPQRIDTYLALMRDAAHVDQGVLHEMGDRLGLEYRTRSSMYNQLPRLALDARSGVGGDIANPFAPAEDDEALRNDVTVSREGGSSYRVADDASIARHGVYDEQITASAYSDDQLADIAGWRLHLGSWPGMRYPSLAPAIDVRPDLAEAWMRTRIGDRATVTGLPPQHPGDVDLLVQGYAESLTPQSWEVDANTTPAGPWTVAVFGDDVLGRADTDGSELAADFVAGVDTTMTVTVTDGPLWTTDSGEFPFEVLVGGVVVEVTAISGSSPQTFTVTQPVNGITKTVAAGSDVRLAHPAIAAW